MQSVTTRGKLVLAVALIASLVAPLGQAQKAALTRDIDNGAFQPVQLKGTVTLTDSCCDHERMTNLDGSAFTVPEGKRLVVEYMSGEMTVPSGLRGNFFGLMTSDRVEVLTRAYFFYPGGGSATSTLFAAGDMVRAYYGPGDEVNAFCNRSSDVPVPSGRTINCLVNAIGYLVTLPTP